MPMNIYDLSLSNTHVIQASGATLQDPPRSPCALTILASNIFPKKTRTTLLMRSIPNTKSPQIGPVPFTYDSLWTGTKPRVMSKSPCLATLSVPYKKIGHPKPKLPQHAPHKGIEPVYGSTQQQQPTIKSATEPLDPKVITHIQSVNGNFVFCIQVNP